MLPYDDEDLRYDYDYHRYVPTVDFIKRKTGMDLKNGHILQETDDSDPSTLGERTLDDLSDHLYRTIYASARRNKNYVEYLLACDPECRLRLKRCFINEIKWALRNGDFWFGLEDYNRELKISPDSFNLLSETLPNGVNLLYRGLYQLPPFRWRQGY